MELQEIIQEFLGRYEWWQFVLALLGILYVLDKYFGISPVDMLIDREKKYSFKIFSHLQLPELKQLIQKFQQKDFHEVSNDLHTMQGDKRSFAFLSLWQYGNIKTTDKWIAQDETSEIPKIVKSYQLIHEAWQVRGSGSIDSVSEKNLTTFKQYLREAGKLISDIHSKEFQTNISSNLLTIYKTSHTPRDIIHSCFALADTVKQNDIELHLSYFSAISPKWGGSQDELHAYFDTLDKKPNLLQKLIHAQYYFDIIHMWNYDDGDGKIEKFLEEVKNTHFDVSDLYRFELYKISYWIANNLGLKKLEKHFKWLASPYMKD